MMIFLLATAWPLWVRAEENPFPQYEELTPNVNFWIKIYSLYTTSQAVVHDSVNLDIIYEVIDIRPYDAPDSREFNRKAMDKASDKYENLLHKLSSEAKSTSDAEIQRVASLFGDRADKAVFRQSAERVRCQVGQKDRFTAGLIRSGAYIEKIREIFKSFDLPEDLAYLPHVESSFNVNAYSKFGAAGMWQFTRGTGQRFMEVGYALDERRDPIRATHAAARLLKENYNLLGDWPMALTAYNHGAAGMEQAKRIHGTYPQIFKYHQSRLFKFASRNFYSEFLAARQVARHYTDYFGDIALDQPRSHHTVALDGYCSFNELRIHFGLSAETLIELNPALRPPVFEGQKLIPKGYHLNLPLNAADGQTPIVAEIPKWLYRTAQMPSRFYTAQSGDTPSKIAKKYGIALTDLLLANDLMPQTKLKPRQTLRIPRPGELIVAKAPAAEAPSALLAAKSEPTPQKLVKNPVAAPTSPATTVAPIHQTSSELAPSSPSAELDAKTPVEPKPVNVPATVPGVEEFPTPKTVASKAELSMNEPLETIKTKAPLPVPPATAPMAGSEKLVLPPHAAQTPSVATKPEPTTPPADELRPNFGIVIADLEVEPSGNFQGIPVGQIKVEIEETLGHYAEWANVRTQKIRDINNLRFNRSVQLGQKIKIPLNKRTAQEFAERRYEFHKRLQDDFFAVYRIGPLKPYQVGPKDTIWTLCRDKFDIPMWLLKHCNPDVDLSQLALNQTLLIPMIEKSTGDEPGIGAPDAPDEDPSNALDPNGDDKNEKNDHTATPADKL